MCARLAVAKRIRRRSPCRVVISLNPNAWGLPAVVLPVNISAAGQILTCL